MYPDETIAMNRIVSCFTNCYGAAGVWKAVELIGAAGLDHIELALRGHNLGGLVIPESAVITEKTDDATAQAFKDHLAKHKVALSGCNVGGADLRTREGVELIERRIRFAARWFGVSIAISGAGQPADAGERRTVVTHLRQIGETAGAHGITVALETHKGPTQNAAAMLALMSDVDHPQVRLNFDHRTSSTTARGRPRRRARAGQTPGPQRPRQGQSGTVQRWYFPTVGDGGGVDFNQIRQIMDGVGFQGPYAIEIEGIGGEPEPSVEERHERVARSVRHLRSCGYQGD